MMIRYINDDLLMMNISSDNSEKILIKNIKQK